MKKDKLEHLLLHAELDELRGIGESETARLVRSSDEVRMTALRLLESLDRMHRSISDVAEAGRVVRIRPAVRRAVLPRFAMRIALAMSVAALFLVARSRQTEDTETATGTEAVPMTAGLQADSDQPFAVFETDNPNIAIVWLFTKEDQP